MNLQALSEVVMSEQIVVPTLQRTEAVQDEVFKARFTAVFNTAYLLATIEGLCAEELADCISPVHETVVGTGVDFKHVKSAVAGKPVFVKGYVVEVADRAVIFFATATQNGETIGTGTLRFAIIPREQSIESTARAAKQDGSARTLAASIPAEPSRFDTMRRESRYRTVGNVQCSL
jgi:predicted thioesterase